MSTRVLVVEDDPAVGDMIRRILGMEGYAATVASDGPSALALLRSAPFDLAVLDVMLPGMDGIEILRAIRQEAGYADLPVVMLTAKTDDETTWAGWRAGCDYYMTKPFEPGDLLAILAKLEAARRPPR